MLSNINDFNFVVGEIFLFLKYVLYAQDCIYLIHLNNFSILIYCTFLKFNIL